MNFSRIVKITLIQNHVKKRVNNSLIIHSFSMTLFLQQIEIGPIALAFHILFRDKAEGGTVDAVT